VSEVTLPLTVLGAASLLLGLAITLSPRLAAWYVRATARGRIWSRLLRGEARAVVVLRRVFGPLAAVLGAALLAWGLSLLAASG
jgi:hypothetical protein